jgi:hypothetical protein
VLYQTACHPALSPKSAYFCGVIFRHIFGVFSWRVSLHHVENTPPKPAVHNGYSFLMISPNLLDIWPMFFLILSRYETMHFLILLRLPGDGFSLLGSKK